MRLFIKNKQFDCDRSDLRRTWIAVNHQSLTPISDLSTLLLFTLFFSGYFVQVWFIIFIREDIRIVDSCSCTGQYA